MSFELIKQNLKLQISNMQPRYKNWDGDLIDLNDYDKDTICYTFLRQKESWWDDMLPPVVINQAQFLDALYHDTPDTISTMLKNAIYLSLELALRDLVQDIYDELNEVQPEPFAGYERGQ